MTTEFVPRGECKVRHQALDKELDTMRDNLEQLRRDQVRMYRAGLFQLAGIVLALALLVVQLLR